MLKTPTVLNVGHLKPLNERPPISSASKIPSSLTLCILHQPKDAPHPLLLRNPSSFSRCDPDLKPSDLSLRCRTHVMPRFSEYPGGDPQNAFWRNIPSPALEQSPDFNLTPVQQLGASRSPQDSLCHPQTPHSPAFPQRGRIVEESKKPNLVHIRLVCHSWLGSLHPINTPTPTFPTHSCPGHSTQGRQTWLWTVV